MRVHRALAMLPPGLVLALLLVAFPGCGDSPPPGKPAFEFTAGWLRECIVQEYTVTGGPDTFDRNSLWEHMNGAAPGYLAYGCEKVIACTAAGATHEVSVAIYDMGSPLNAFGIHSVERSPEGVSEVNGTGAYAAEDCFYFWQNRYYVKLNLLDETASGFFVVRALADLLSGELPEVGFEPVLFHDFPAEGRITHSEAYTATDVLGREYLCGGYSVLYDAGEDSRIVVLRGDSAAAAEEMFAKYRSEFRPVPERGGDDRGGCDAFFEAQDSYYGTVLCALRGEWMIVSLGLERKGTSEDELGRFFDRLED